MASNRQLEDKDLRKILQGLKIPPQPQVIVDISIEQMMPDPDLQRISNLIRRDVGLAGTILKVVNSSMFGLKNRISSIDQAVNILGLPTIMRISQGISIKSEMSDETISAMTGFWDSASDVASAAAYIAREIGFHSPDKAYCLGLFHNCGVAMLFSSHPNEYEAVLEQSYREPSPRIIDVENAMLKTNHAVVGYYVAKTWGLTKDICDVIAEHHNAASIFNETIAHTRISADEDHGKKTLLAILKMAEHACKLHLVLGHQEEDLEWQAIATPVLDYVGLSAFDFNEMAEDLNSLGNTSTRYYDLCSSGD